MIENNNSHRNVEKGAAIKHKPYVIKYMIVRDTVAHVLTGREKTRDGEGENRGNYK